MKKNESVMAECELQPSATLKLFNTLTRQKEPLMPQEAGHVKMYTCGPTVYNYAHIGNFRTYVFEDLLRRTMQFFGMKVTQAMNLTDVDDKTIKGALAKNISLDAYTKPFKEAFFEDAKTLRIEPVEFYPAATDYMEEMIKMIQKLISIGIAYTGGDGSVYYAIKKFPHYGCLSHLHLEELQAGASERVAADEYDKDHIADFVLWKKYDPARDGSIFWESPFGPGRPGWHLECSAMAMKLLGETLDIHVGGVDNMFPHHENEIAQSEACSGKPLAKMWLHSEHLVVDNKKMSKSFGNFFTLRDLLNKGYTGVQIRYMLLQTHYKTQLNFTFAGLEAVKNSLHRLKDFIQRMQEIQNDGETGSVDHALLKAYQGFSQALADDLNISAALAALFDLVREINGLCDENLLLKKDATKVLELLRKFNTVLAIFDFDQHEEQIPHELQEALEKRIQARKEKNWSQADSLRDYIHSQGYVIEDTPKGARLKKETKPL
jgi:cysteinyl-tRNA synthetase